MIAGQLTKTLIAMTVVAVAGLAIELLLLKRIKNNRKKLKATIISRNILVIMLVIVLFRIWIEGFFHLIALLGFIAAALTITQKENILNLTGGFIIMWRHTFAEGDLVSIANHTGIIKQLGIFYFVIEEIVLGTINEKTGRVIKIPNSLVSLNPFTVYEFDQFVFVDKSYYFSFQSDLTKLESCVEKIAHGAQAMIEEYQKSLSSDQDRELKKLIKKNKYQEMSCDLKIIQNSYKGYRVRILGHCPVVHENELYHFLDKFIIDQAKKQSIRLLED